MVDYLQSHSRDSLRGPLRSILKKSRLVVNLDHVIWEDPFLSTSCLIYEGARSQIVELASRCGSF